MGRKSNNSQIISNNYNPSNDEKFAKELQDASRIIMLHGDVDEAVISQVIATLLNLATISLKPVNLVISTYGGSVDEMFSLYDIIKVLPCPVHTIALGKVMSAGVLLLAAGTKGKRLVGNTARIMIHAGQSGIHGTILTIENHKQEMERQHNVMIDCLSRETKMSKKEIQKIMKSGNDHYLTAKQAMKLGIVDQIVGE